MSFDLAGLPDPQDVRVADVLAWLGIARDRVHAARLIEQGRVNVVGNKIDNVNATMQDADFIDFAIMVGYRTDRQEPEQA